MMNHQKSDRDETVLKCLAAYHVSQSERRSHCRRDAALFVLGAGTCFVKAKRWSIHFVKFRLQISILQQFSLLKKKNHTRPAVCRKSKGKVIAKASGTSHSNSRGFHSSCATSSTCSCANFSWSLKSVLSNLIQTIERFVFDL